MTSREVGILNSLITFAAENIPGGLSTEEHEVAFQVAVWANDGVPIRQVCPHCGVAAPRGEGRLEWLERHIDSAMHKWFWTVKKQFRRVDLLRVR